MSTRTLSPVLSLALLGACVDYGFHGKTGDEPGGEEVVDTAVPASDTGEAPGDTGDPEDAVELGQDSCECPDGFDVSEDGASCFAVTTFPATPTGEVVEVCPIEPFRTYGAYGARYPGGTVEKNAYWGQNDQDLLGRLNEVGVWGCDAPGSSTAGHAPVRSWIGFTVCLEVPAPGDYIVGLAGDNRVRMTVDDELLFEQTDDDMKNFKYWHLRSLELDAGSHRIDLEGYNAGSVAAFGAEVSGPFPSGSLADDAGMQAADYDGGLIWSTSDAIGSAFPLGDAQSWTCPDGSSFQGCESPVCEEVDVVPCL